MSRESRVVSIKKTSYRDLKVWQKAIALAKQVYQLTEVFPPREQYGLSAQLRRSAVSVASNIAEGAARHSDKDYAHFLVIARGSLAELHTQCVIAHEVGFLSVTDLNNFQIAADEISKMLSGLRSRLTTND